jgi:signal transduction histidine kinase/ActR/RegA family two-component response regulator
MSIDTRVIRAEPHVEIGSLLHRDAAVLIERWCRRAIEEQPNAKRVHYEVLRDRLPTLLRSMARSLMQSGDPEPNHHREMAIEHGEQRWDTGWSLTEVVRDYQILQLVTLEHLEKTLDRPLRYREVMAVGVLIDDAVAASITTYVASRDEYIRSMERERTEALQETNRRKDEFLAVLSHELRNPLAPITNSVKVLQLLLPKADAPVLQAVEVIERQTHLLVQLVDDLLDLTRVAQGRLELHKKVIDVAGVLEQAVQTSGPLIKSRHHQLTTTLPPNPVYLEADPARLVQVVVNLLNNAAKYTISGGQILLSALREGEEAVIRVRDNGLGISAEMLPRVFELFTRGNDPQNRSPDGLGIGLALVKQLVELHGGTVSAASEGAGRGSEFVVRLPARAAAAQAPAPAAPPGRAEAVAAAHLLLVEDNADAREALAILLRLLGHHVEVAENGGEGIEKAAALKPRVALIDIGLPDVNGYEVAKQLRATLGDRIFLIALSGYGQTDDLRRALDAGFDAHLVKPAEVDELNRLLARALSGKSG